MKNPKKSGHKTIDWEHIPYEVTNDALRWEQFFTISVLTEAVVEITPLHSAEKILDFACGRGELLAELKKSGYQTYGCDMDEVCVELSSPYGVVQKARIEDLSDLYKPQSFSLVIASHVLEHIVAPAEALKQLMSLSKNGVVVAIPNPFYLPFIFRALLRLSPSPATLGHWYSWDYSHFKNFVENCGFSVNKWYYDSVALPLSRPQRHTLGFKVLQFFEGKILRALFPKFCRSIIAHVVRNDGQSDLPEQKS